MARKGVSMVRGITQNCSGGRSGCTAAYSHWCGVALGVVLMVLVSGPTRAACMPAVEATPVYLSEGPANATDRSINLPAQGSLRGVVLFVDFSDAPGTLAPADQITSWMQAGLAWLRVSSYRKLKITLDPVLQWWRMPQPSTSYGFPGISYAAHRNYIADVLALADATVDFSRADFIYIVSAPKAAIPGSPTFRGLPGTFVLDGRDVSRVITFGNDAYTYGKTALVHETGHLLGFPDLYAFTGKAHRFVGIWDLMGNIFQPTDFNAWHRLKVGWLQPNQFVCAREGGRTRAVLTPLARPRGKKAVFVRTGPYTALVVENRQKLANDKNICATGLVVYTVDARTDTGHGPVKVRGGTMAGCGYGPRSDAVLQPGERLKVGGRTVEALPGAGLDLTVRVY